ncbi:MAG: hypothetical protein IPL78_20615 [Chloroflexi bacterium]|nr:hypothetical protein [Chloroflexota bacterium]
MWPVPAVPAGSPVRPATAGNDALSLVPQRCINSATTGPWNSGATWVGGVVPPTTEGACILNGHTVTLDTSPQIQQLVVETGGALVIPTGFSLTAENFVNSNGTMAQTLTVNNANVPFLEIRNPAGTVVKYRGVELKCDQRPG